jgi:hypothetical protein
MRTGFSALWPDASLRATGGIWAALALLAGGCATPTESGPPPPTLQSVYGGERFAVELELAAAGVLRSRARARLTGQDLTLVPRPFAPPPRGGPSQVPPSAPWDLGARLGTPFSGDSADSLLGRFSSGFLEAEFTGQIDPRGLSGQLAVAEGPAVGRLVAHPEAIAEPHSYPELARRIESAARGAWVEVRRLELNPWRIFIDDLQRGFATCQDDVEVWLCFERARQELAAPALRLTRALAAPPAPAEQGAPRSLPADWLWASPAALSRSARIDATIEAWPLEARGAVLDLRGSGAADLQLARLLAWLGLPAESLGVLASQGYFRGGRERDEPVASRAAESLFELPPGGWPARLRLDPGSLPVNRLARPRLELILLLDGGSGPTATALALALKQAGRAQLVGRTPERIGEVCRAVPLGDGFELVLPVAYFLDSLGKPLLETRLALDMPAEESRECELAAVGLAL